MAGMSTATGVPASASCRCCCWDKSSATNHERVCTLRGASPNPYHSPMPAGSASRGSPGTNGVGTEFGSSLGVACPSRQMGQNHFPCESVTLAAAEVRHALWYSRWHCSHKSSDDASIFERHTVQPHVSQISTPGSSRHVSHHSLVALGRVSRTTPLRSIDSAFRLRFSWSAGKFSTALGPRRCTDASS